MKLYKERERKRKRQHIEKFRLIDDRETFYGVSISLKKKRNNSSLNNVKVIPRFIFGEFHDFFTN